MGVNIKRGIVIKALNNNMVLIKEHGVEKILLAKGIGFNKKFGDILEDNLEVDKVFSIEDKKNQENLKEVYNRVDGEFVAICEEALAEISEELGEELNETIHIGLIDHLAIAMKRLKNKEQINNPFIVEIETLYSVEFEMAKKIVNKLQDKYEIDFPEGEIGFITLHIHSARNGKMLSNSIKYSYLSNKIIIYIEEKFNSKIDKRSLDYARFLSHVRFTIERVLTDTVLKNDLTEIIKKSYPVSYEIAEGASKIIEETLDKKVCDDEVAYIAMHVERFRVALQK
ncbi:PRD domain-containing protein [uncultured Clostridium sp.]|uniref:PRD domain-containing protein n=1 Tax=uncultured Clostridium sp. TaxID=59620 RepID=UPI00266EF987|nr:PRD domain-containing protein [uncultured Clostridium sp.]